jgi:uncharacterized protein (DUF2384 family)
MKAYGNPNDADGRFPDSGRPPDRGWPSGERRRQHCGRFPGHRIALGRRKATPDIHRQTVIANLAYIARRLADFYEPAKTRLWLNARHPLLENQRPIDLIRNGDPEPVLALIEQLDSGVYL